MAQDLRGGPLERRRRAERHRARRLRVAAAVDARGQAGLAGLAPGVGPVSPMEPQRALSQSLSGRRRKTSGPLWEMR